MNVLTRLSIKRLIKQKFIYVSFLCFFLASFFYAFLIANPEMENMLNINTAEVGKGNFPEFMIRFYIGIVGTLFVTFLIALYICEEAKDQLLYQPLLHGKGRTEILKSKITILCTMSFVFVIIVAIINYLVAYFRWGGIVFDMAACGSILVKYLLLAFYMVCISLGIVLACICTRSSLITILMAVIYIVLDNVISASEFSFLKYIWIGSYPNAWLFTYEYKPIPIKSILSGCIIILTYGIVFYHFAMQKIRKINF